MVYPVIPRQYRIPGLVGLAVVTLLLLGGTLLVQADTSPDTRPGLLRGISESLGLPDLTRQYVTPVVRATVPPTVVSLPAELLYAAVPPPQLGGPTVGRATPSPLPSPSPVGLRGQSDTAPTRPALTATLVPSPPATPLPAGTATLAAVALMPPRTATPTPNTFLTAPAFGVTSLPSKTPIPATPTLLPTLPPSPTLIPSLTASPTLIPSPSPQASAVSTVVPSPTLPPTPLPTLTLTPSPTPSPRQYKLGDTVAITQVLKGFAFTGHWPNSPEGVYATDWYPGSTTQPCANSHRLPLAMPVGGKWRLVSAPSPIGGNMYSLIGELDDGNTVGFTHVDRDVLTGRQEANTVVAFVGISGLEAFDSAGLNPSHAHTAWNDRVVSGWDGDAGNRPARDFFTQYGFQVEIRDAATGATPQSYMMRQGCGGMLGVPRGAGRG